MNLKNLILIMFVNTNIQFLMCLKREKRELIFGDATRFTLRMDIKDTVLPFTTIIAHAFGFKVAWDLPHKPLHMLRRKKRNQSSNMFSNILEIIEMSGIKEYYCLVKHACNYFNDFNNNEFFYRMFHFVLRKSTDEEKRNFLDDVYEICVQVIDKCEFNYLEPCLYTDLY